jgi:hypothetical protein
MLKRNVCAGTGGDEASILLEICLECIRNIVKLKWMEELFVVDMNEGTSMEIVILKLQVDVYQIWELKIDSTTCSTKPKLKVVCTSAAMHGFARSRRI